MRRTLATLLLIAGPLCLGSVRAGAEGAGSAIAVDVRAVAFVPDFGERKGFLGRREAQPFGRLGLFVERRALPTGLRTSMFDLEGGATLALRHNLRLTGGYRLLDYGIDRRGTGLVSQHAGPCVGFSLRF